jgi:hypothetical protein
MTGGEKIGALCWTLHHGKTYDSRYLCATLIKHDGTFVTASNKEEIQEMDSQGRKISHVVAPSGSNISSRGSAKLWTSVTGFGNDFIVFWTEKRWGQDVQIGSDRCKVFAARVLADGARCPDRKTPINIGAERDVNYLRPAACKGPMGNVLVVYERDKALADHKIVFRLTS